MTFLIQSKSPGNVIEISRIHGNPRICNLDAGDTPYQEVYIRVSERLTNLSRDTGFSANDQTMMKRGQHA